jgi:RHS repeat-associated protein
LQESKSLLGAGYSEQRIDYGYDAVYQLTSEVVRVDGGAAVTNAWTYDAAGNVKTASGKFGTAEATVNADNELVDWTQGVQQITVTGQVEPGANSNNWFASTATAQGHSAPVSMQDGSFAIVGVPVNTGENVLTATVTDVSGNTATRHQNFTVGSAGSTTFSYDANGNLASSATVPVAVVYQYDAENRLVSVTSNGVTVLQCWYDGSGRRVAKREVIGTQTNTFQYVWDGWNLVAVLGENGKLKEFCTRGVGIAGDIGTLVAVTPYSVAGFPFATRYLHNNHRGDVIMARQGTNTVATLEYAPYGELRSYSGTYTPRFRFSSKEYDASAGFYHFPYRYYAPQWARWVTRDVSGERVGDLNLYRYVANNPLDACDSDGLGIVSGVGKAIAGPGKLCTSKSCKKEECKDKAKMLPETGYEDKKDPWESIPDPGNCKDADAVAAPKGMVKIPNGVTCTIECGKDGKPSYIECKKKYWWVPDPVAGPSIPGLPAPPSL